MPDICDLILDEHETFRRRFAELDAKREADAKTLSALWDPLAALLERHAAAEEALFYPHLLRHGSDAEDETEDAVGDHNDIRDGVRKAAEHPVGSSGWWAGVDEAREENSKHMAEEEREALADFRRNAEPALREEIGAAFLRYIDEHAGARDLPPPPEDPQEYIEQHS